MKKFEIIKKIIPYVFLVILAIIICLPLIKEDLDITRDDGIQHICRLIGTHDSIKEGQIFPVIMSSFCNGFGYNWNTFYSPFTAIAPLIFGIITNDYVIMLKLFLFCSILFSGITMFWFAKAFCKNEKAGILIASIYMLAPYHLTDMYLRVAVAEFTSFIFIPLVFLGLYNIFNQYYKKSYYLIIGAVGLILTHTLSCLLVAIFCFFYVLINIKKLKDKKILQSLIYCTVLIILCSSIFILPLLEYKNSATYEVFVPGRMERGDVLVNNKLSFYQLFYTSNNDTLVFEIGLITIIGLLLTPIVIDKKVLERKQQNTYYFFCVSGIIACLITLKFFPFEKLPDFIKMLQFPWRMLEIAVFFFSIVTGFNFSLLIKNFGWKDVGVIIAINVILTGVSIIPKLEYKNFDISQYIPALPLTSNTGRVHGGMASLEYMPTKAFKNRSYIETRDQKVHVITGEANIKEEKKQNTTLYFKLNTKKGTKLELPYLFYPGYTVLIKEDSNNYYPPLFETENGMIGVQIDKDIENAEVFVKFTGTRVMMISYILTAIGLILTIIYFKKIK